MGQITAYDIWATLAGGRYILTHGLPATDPFSFTAAGQPWVNQMWLTQVMFYWVYANLGRDPLILLKVVVVASTLGLVWRSAARGSGSPATASFVTALVGVAGAPWWHLRPQIFTYLCLAGTLTCLCSWKEGSRWPLLGIPALMAVWVNLHAGFIVGLVVLAVWWLGVLIERSFLGAGFGASGSLKTLAWVTGLTLVATLANPYGFRIYAFPIRMTTSQFALETSVDWYSPNFLAPAMLPALVFILLLCAALALAGRRLAPIDVLLLVTFLGSSLRSGRNLPLFVIVSAPLLAELIVVLIQPLRGQWPRLTRVAAACLAAFLFLGSAFEVWIYRIPARNPFLQELNEKRYPIEVVEFFHAYHPPPHLFNAFLWAGYELWALPEYQVFIDNRFEVYPEPVFRDYLDVTYVTPRWEQVLNRWNVRTLIVGRDSALAHVLQFSAGWALAFSGREAGVFLKVGDPATSAILSRQASSPQGSAAK